MTRRDEAFERRVARRCHEKSSARLFPEPIFTWHDMTSRINITIRRGVAWRDFTVDDAAALCNIALR